MTAKLKDIEGRLIAELMKNSRRSDRELAKVLGVSQPTISRTIKKLELEGMIKEYTIIPDFKRLGFQLMSVNFVRYKAGTPESDIAKMRQTARRLEKERGLPYVLVMKGMGLGFDSVLIMFHNNYSSFATLRKMMAGAGEGDVASFESFLIDLNDEGHFQPLTLSALAGYLMLEKKRISERSETNPNLKVTS
jgi:DNA-binding Lrp family transcriptional regulator